MLTPMMQQFRDAKAKYPGMMVLFRNGDFYELFEEDAELGSRFLGLTLTKRDGHVPMAGFPHHKLESYLAQLLRGGHRVAVCEQMEEAGPGKKLIRREVNRVVTPGTVTEDELLDPRAPNHLAALTLSRNQLIGLAWVDLSTGTFSAFDLEASRLPDELARLNPAEVLASDEQLDKIRQLAPSVSQLTFTTRPAWTFDPSGALERLRQHFQVHSLTGFGLSDDQPCLLAAGAVLAYLQETLRSSLAHIRGIKPYRTDGVLMLDEVTRRSLELTRTLRDNLREGSLLAVLDRTVTPMGSRLLMENLLAPLNQRAAIVARLDAVDELVKDHTFRGGLRQLLEAAADLQRLTTRVSTAKANPKDLAAVSRTLKLLPRIKAALTSRRSVLLQSLEQQLQLCPEIRELLDQSLSEDPPYHLKDPDREILRPGYNAELDELRRLAKDGKDWIARYQAEEITRTGIQSLKVGFTDVMGYYIEITNANETRVPPDYIHERTLKNCKRYSTPRLKEYEEKVVTAQERSKALEVELFFQIRDAVAARTAELLQTADVLAQADFLAGLAELASSRNYIKPAIVDEPILHIREGRHPVLEQTTAAGSFVPNDVILSPAEGMFWLITGPNMSGKSTFIRQVALLTLLAHVGSFVPAKSATIGITDRIFTRVGASDELSRGQSTFMVEMTEAANILNNATSRSLVILDEIGRGTSTYDGVSLAWAMTEHLHNELGARTLFATHYHELAQLAEQLPRLRNYTVQVRESANEVIFLHRIMPGSADKSYGIHVARLAGVPESVLARAEKVLAALEGQPATDTASGKAKSIRSSSILKQQIVVEPPERPRKKHREPAGPSLFQETQEAG